MRTYRKYLELANVPLPTDSVIMHLTRYYKLYNIQYSKDLSTVYIGDFYLKKLLDTGKTSYKTGHSATYYNMYEIGYTKQTPQYNLNHAVNNTITCDEMSFVFDLIDDLDKLCYTEYTKRKKREQLLTNIKQTLANMKSLPRQFIETFGREKGCCWAH